MRWANLIPTAAWRMGKAFQTQPLCYILIFRRLVLGPLHENGSQSESLLEMGLKGCVGQKNIFWERLWQTQIISDWTLSWCEFKVNMLLFFWRVRALWKFNPLNSNYLEIINNLIRLTDSRESSTITMMSLLEGLKWVSSEAAKSE